MIPVFGISIPFIFVLLILLLTKTPKLGVWVIGGLIAAVAFGFLIFMPIAVHDRLLPNILPRSEAIPLVGITIPFLFVLLIILLNKAPKVGAGVIVGVVVMGLLGAVLWLGASHRPVAYEQPIESRVMVRQATQSNRGSHAHGDPERALEMAYPEESLLRARRPQSVEEPARIQQSFAQSLTGRGASAEPAVTSPIWSEGVENEYEADICPSRLAAVRALGRRMRKPIEHVVADMQTVAKIVIFQDENDGSLAGPFKQALAEALPDIPCAVMFGSRNIDANEIGITVRSHFVQSPLLRGDDRVVRPQLLADARHRDWEATVRQDFIDKPWVEDFARYASEQPQKQFVVARSWETCTSENEAKTQAIRDACDQVSALVGQKWSTVPGQAPLTVSSTDLLEGAFIADQFVQSFDGMSGRLWRQALLIDTSAEKLGWLGSRKTAGVHVVRTTWAHMILSVLGVMVVIVATYLFLNMATRGYYVWSLRIAGVVLAVMGVVSILLVLR